MIFQDTHWSLQLLPWDWGPFRPQKANVKLWPKRKIHLVLKEVSFLWRFLVGNAPVFETLGRCAIEHLAWFRLVATMLNNFLMDIWTALVNVRWSRQSLCDRNDGQTRPENRRLSTKSSSITATHSTILRWRLEIKKLLCFFWNKIKIYCHQLTFYRVCQEKGTNRNNHNQNWALGGQILPILPNFVDSDLHTNCQYDQHQGKKHQYWARIK